MNERPKAQVLEVTNVAWALAQQQHILSSEVLDALCGHLFELLHLPARHVANLAWALLQFKHVPPSDLASAMISRILDLCQIAGQQPNPQEISNLLLASAQLRFTMTAVEAGTLLTYLLHQDTASAQSLPNAAWSLAALGLLQLDAFTQLLCRLMVMSTPLTPPDLQQMYQALDRLQPPSDAAPQQQKAWSDAEAEVQALGPRPVAKQQRTFAQFLVVLNRLGLKYTAPARVKSYSIQAAIQPQISPARHILISIMSQDCFANDPTR